MPPDQLLNQIFSDFQTQAGIYFPAVVNWMTAVLACMTFLQLGWLSVNLMYEGQAGIDTLFWTYFWGLGRVLIVYVIMDNAWDWASDVVLAGQQIGQHISGESFGVLTPSGIYDTGLTIIGDLWRARTAGSWFHPIDDVAFVGVVMMTWFTWFAAANIYLWLMIECIWIVATGPVHLAFSTLDMTRPTLYAWGGKLLALSVKALVTLLMLAIGMNWANQWSADLSSMGTAINSARVYYATVALAESVMFFFMVWILPAVAAGLIRTGMGSVGGSVAESAAGNAIETTAAAVTTVAGAAMSGGAGELGSYVRSKLLQ